MLRVDEAAANHGTSGARGFESELLLAMVDRYLTLLATGSSNRGLKAVMSQYGGTDFGHYEASIDTDADWFGCIDHRVKSVRSLWMHHFLSKIILIIALVKRLEKEHRFTIMLEEINGDY